MLLFKFSPSTSLECRHVIRAWLRRSTYNRTNQFIYEAKQFAE